MLTSSAMKRTRPAEAIGPAFSVEGGFLYYAGVFESTQVPFLR